MIPTTDLRMIAVGRLRPHPQNPRLALRQEVIDGIAATLKADGAFRPEHALRVRPVGDWFQVVGGHQRREAAVLAGLAEVPCWVREMTDEEAYMALVLDNRQGELSPLEIGLHALTKVGRAKAGRGKTGGLSQYAQQLGKSKQYISQLVAAAEVAKSSTQVDDLPADCAKHLFEIHSLPESAWPGMVQAMLDQKWQLKDAKAAVERFEEYRKDPAVADWDDYLPVEACALAVAVGAAKAADFRHLAWMGREVVRTLGGIDGLKGEDRDRLCGEWNRWLADNRGADSWDAARVSARRDGVEKQAVALADRRVEDDHHVLHGDFREVGKSLGDASVDLVFTDPPYDRESLPLYGDMAELAARVLKPGGSLVCYLGQYQIHEVCRLVTPHLRLWWTLACNHAGPFARMNEYGIVVKWKPMLWFVKGTRGDKQTMVDDLVLSRAEKDTHEWQQSLVEAGYYIEKLCPPGGLVFDPFCGGGTTALAARRAGRRWVTCDTDEAAVRNARKRMDESQW